MNAKSARILETSSGFRASPAGVGPFRNPGVRKRDGFSFCNMKSQAARGVKEHRK